MPLAADQAIVPVQPPMYRHCRPLCHSDSLFPDQLGDGCLQAGGIDLTDICFCLDHFHSLQGYILAPCSSSMVGSAVNGVNG